MGCPRPGRRHDVYAKCCVCNTGTWTCDVPVFAHPEDGTCFQLLLPAPGSVRCSFCAPPTIESTNKSCFGIDVIKAEQCRGPNMKKQEDIRELVRGPHEPWENCQKCPNLV